MSSAPSTKPRVVNPYRSKAKVVNPYLRSSKQPPQKPNPVQSNSQRSAPASNLNLVKSAGPNPTTIRHQVKKTLTGIPSGKSMNVTKAKSKHIVKMQPPLDTSSSNHSPSGKTTQAQGMSSITMKKASLTTSKRPRTLKMKLKQEIESIRKANALGKQQKQLRKEQKALEKQRREQERLKAKEEEKQRTQHAANEERQRRLAEQKEKLRQEGQKKQEADHQIQEGQLERQRALLLHHQHQMQLRQKKAAESILQITTSLQQHREHMAACGPGPHNDQHINTFQVLQKAVDQSLPKTQEMRHCMLSRLEHQVGTPGFGQQQERLCLLALLRHQPVTNIGWEDMDSHPTGSLYPHPQQMHFLFKSPRLVYFVQTGQWDGQTPPAHPQLQHPQTRHHQQQMQHAVSSARPRPSGQVAAPLFSDPHRPSLTNLHAAAFLPTPRKSPAASSSTAVIPTKLAKPKEAEQLATTQTTTIADITNSDDDHDNSTNVNLVKTQTTTTVTLEQQRNTGLQQQVAAPAISRTSSSTVYEPQEHARRTERNSEAPSGTSQTITPHRDKLSATAKESSSTTPDTSTNESALVTPTNVSPARHGGPTTVEIINNDKGKPSSKSKAVPSKESDQNVTLPTSCSQPPPPTSMIGSSRANSEAKGLAVAPTTSAIYAWNPYYPPPNHYGRQGFPQPRQELNHHGQHPQSIPPEHGYPPHGGHYPYQYQAQPVATNPYYATTLNWQHQAGAAYFHMHPFSSFPTNIMLPPAYSQYSTTALRLKAPRAPRQRKPKPPVVQRLAWDPIDPPSPYARTHILMTQTFIVVKKPGESFARNLSLKEAKQSVLVPLQWLAENKARMKQASAGLAADVSTKTAEAPQPRGRLTSKLDAGEANKKPKESQEGSSPKSPKTQSAGENQPQIASPQIPKRPRRKRHCFAVIMVMDASLQNERIPTSMHLHPGDLIVAANGVSPGGFIFQEACLLLENGEQKEEEEGCIQCSLTIARRKPLPPTKIKHSPTLSAASITPQIAVKPLTDLDLEVFTDCVMRALRDTQRMLGAEIAERLLRALLDASPGLVAERDFSRLKAKWDDIIHTTEKEIMLTAKAFWIREWEKEREKYPASVATKCLTDRRRAQLRSSPRPMRGCRCGSQDHEYVDDLKCPLYTDVLPFSNRERKAHDPQKTTKKKGDERRPVETAFKDRFVKQQAKKKALEEEAYFVQEMEEAQVQKLQRAIFAPSLTAMVLSAVLDLQNRFPPQEVRDDVTPSPYADMRDDLDGNDDDEDDNIPLAALGKREGSVYISASKKHRADTGICNKFLAESLRLISSRWGHVFHAESDEDYAWRWEVYHGQTETRQNWAEQITNPKKSKYPFENLSRFLLTDEFIRALGNQEEQAKLVRAQVVLSFLVAPGCTGVYDEILALQRFCILEISKNGIPRPTGDWYKRVDLLLLNETLEWSDKHLVSNIMRRKLHEKWAASDHGWALRDDPNDIIYDFDEWDEWRQHFEEKQEAMSDSLHGIGQFGL